MIRIFIAAVVGVMVPALASAQEAKTARLADYVSFCLAIWEDARDLPSKASALGLTDAAGSTGASMTVGKTTLKVYKSMQPNQNVGASFTNFKDGKDWSCDINLPMTVERGDLDTMEQAADLDGQIMTFGPVMMARWKMRQPRPPVLIKAFVNKTTTVLMVQKYEPTPIGANAKASR
ncbi:MAG: hypothetical protein JO220_05580 [Hyphomicrobiales bacterium]|nr:hypothetical protein [Hyphomicrobiales bacterium]